MNRGDIDEGEEDQTQPFANRKHHARGHAFEEDKLSVKNAGNLELKWKIHLDNKALSMTALTAPLVASDVTTPEGVKTLVYVAGSSNHVFAVDAATGKLAWSHDFTAHVSPAYEGMWLCPNNLNATPVIERRAGLIYALNAEGRLFGLDLGDGKERFGPVQFVPPYSKVWSLNLFEGVIYTSISQNCADTPSGIYATDIRDQNRPVVRALLVDDHGAGVWGRGGPVISPDGRLFAATGDGDFDPSAGHFGSSVLALATPDLHVVDFYAPNDFARITRYDLDLGATSAAWFADGNFHLSAAGGKGGTLYLMNADSLGDLDHHTPLEVLRLSNDEQAYEENGIWGSISSWRDADGTTWVYVPVWGVVSKDAPKFPVNNGPVPDGCIMAFKLGRDPQTHKPVLVPAWTSVDFNRPDPVVIANGVVFGVSTGENPQQTSGTRVVYQGQKLLSDVERAEHARHVVLYAMDAKTGKVLYSSGDTISTWVHFSGLAVANAQVYVVDHDSNLYCFGLKSHEK
ncbi:MAG: hypothetical protein DMG21_14045 [Acidobacteria bacterium]|nr:MAG: hypothetical protein DMG21_14045 [Acidobacteriota bacterium]